MVKRVFRIAIAASLIAPMITIVVINAKLNNKPETMILNGDTINHDLLKELRGVKRALNDNADIEMQTIYPEGYMFLNAVYSLAWCNFLRQGKNKMFFDEGLSEIEKSWIKMNSAQTRSIFNKELLLPYGSFYVGWSSYVLGKKLSIKDSTSWKNDEVIHFKQQCAKIAEAIQESTYPDTYNNSAWPADVVVCVASLSLHDRLFTPEYKDIIGSWLNRIKKRLDANGMIPHSVNSNTGTALQGARGSSQALMLILLQEIDPPFANAQFKLFKERFIDTMFGLTAIREHPKGEPGSGDVDSGPVIFGFGGAATIVGMQTLSVYGEHALSMKLRNIIEVFALAHQHADCKKYLFGLLPMADAFIAWSHSNMKITDSGVPFTRFRIYSIVVFILLSILFWLLIKGRQKQSLS